MGIIDYIKKIINNNKKNPQIIIQNLTKTYMTTDQLEIGLYHNKEPLTTQPLYITINGRTYERKTDTEGIARLNINLLPQEYNCYIDYTGNTEYNPTNAYTKVTVKGNTRMEGTDIRKTVSEQGTYQCAVYDYTNNRLNTTVDIKVNGVTYNRTTDTEGLAKLPIRLPQGKYTLTATYNGDKIHNSSQITNTITILQDPKPTPNIPPQKSRSEKILDEFEKYFGKCEYIDDALAKIKGRGYKFYFSDGYNMSETIKRVYNRQGANCYDISEVLYHLALGMNTKYGRKYEVWYLQVWCPKSGYDHIRLRLRSNGGSYFYRDGASVLSGNDITSNWCGTSNNIMKIDPSFIKDG